MIDVMLNPLHEAPYLHVVSRISRVNEPSCRIALKIESKLLTLQESL
jgi:hypothetical protein